MFYDGESYSRLSLFEWKNLINKNKIFNFKGSKVADYNFKSGSQNLFYYRI